MDLGNFDPRRRLPRLERAPVAPAAARSLELAVTMARDLDGDDDDDSEADRLRGRGHQSYLARGVDVLAKRPDELSLAQVEAALRRTKRELRAVNRANQAIPTDAPRIPVPKEYRDAEYPVSLAPDLDGRRRPAPRVVMFREGDVWKRRLAKPAPRHRRPPPEPFRNSLSRRDLRLARDGEERDRLNAARTRRAGRRRRRRTNGSRRPSGARRWRAARPRTPGRSTACWRTRPSRRRARRTTTGRRRGAGSGGRSSRRSRPTARSTSWSARTAASRS